MLTKTFSELAGAFFKLGCLSFGGPVAHLGYFRQEFVKKRGWLSDQRYGGLVALCQFLPGPASSQIAFAIGAIRGGLVGGIIASLFFLVPSAIFMIAAGVFFISSAASSAELKWLVEALKLIAVPFVAQAVFGMGRTLCRDRSHLLVALLAAALNIFQPSTGLQILTMLAAALWGGVMYQTDAPAKDVENSFISNTANDSDVIASSVSSPISPRVAKILFLIFVIMLTWALIYPVSTDLWQKTLAIFFSSGSLVFGGGHVILPLLRDQLVPVHLISDELFLSGYGLAQVVPGPLFSFAGYLGSVIFSDTSPLLGGIWCLLAIFLPAWLLIACALPFWENLQKWPLARGMLSGANAAVVGILLAAFYSPVCHESLKAPTDLLLSVLAFIGLESGRIAPAIVVVLLVIARFLLGS